jgi:hypothetical protein
MMYISVFIKLWPGSCHCTELVELCLLMGVSFSLGFSELHALPVYPKHTAQLVAEESG